MHHTQNTFLHGSSWLWLRYATHFQCHDTNMNAGVVVYYPAVYVKKVCRL